MTLQANPLTTRVKLLSEALRRIPRGTRGKARLARLLLGTALGQNNGLLRCRDGMFVVPSLRGNVAFHMLIDGVYEPDEIDFVLRRLPVGGCFLDVGANIEIFSVAASTRVGSSGRVIGVEASPKIFQYLERNVALNSLRNATMVNRAVTDQPGRLPFYDAPAAGNFGMGTLTNLFGTDPTYVEAGRLDDLLADVGVDHVDVMKMDVEGHEGSVLRGAPRLLHCDAPPLILFEFCDWAEEKAQGLKKGAAQRVLLEAGFEIWMLDDYIRGGSPLKDVITSGFCSLVARKAQL